MMNELVKQVNQSIDEKRERLKEKVANYLAATSVSVPTRQLSGRRSETTATTSPVSFLLYGLAGACVLGALFAESKLLLLGIGAACGFGGFAISRPKQTRNSDDVIGNNDTSIEAVKTDVHSKVLDVVKRTSNEWADFMEHQQKVILNAINTSNLNMAARDEMLTKTTLYEVIDISMIEIANKISAIKSNAEVRTCVESLKLLISNAIDTAADKQKAKYQSLV